MPKTTTAPTIFTLTTKFIFLILISFVSPQPAFAQHIVINEFLPDLPKGEDESSKEWVELYNPSSATINLNGFLLQDKAGNQLVISSSQTLTQSTLLSPGSFLVVFNQNSRFSLNNSGDEVLLFDATDSGNLLDEITYSSSSENQSIGRVPDGSDNLFFNLNPTPGETNSPPPTPSTQPSSTPTTQPQASSPTLTPKSTVSANKPSITPPPSTQPHQSLSRAHLLFSLASPSALSAKTNTTISTPSTSTQNQPLSSAAKPSHSFSFFFLSGACFISASVFSLYRRNST